MTASFSSKAGQKLQQHVDVSQDPSKHVAVRAELVEAARRSNRKGWQMPALAAAVAAMAVALFVWLRPASDAPVAFEVGRTGDSGEIGRYYAAPAEKRDLELRFADSSVVQLRPGGGARVTDLNARGATVLLENGKAHVDVVHKPNTEWTVAAGPYSIRVTGTSFDVSWNVHTSELVVEMHSGSVMVRGPGIETGVEVSGNERFVSRASARVEKTGAATHAQVEADTPETPGEAKARREPESDDVTRTPPGSDSPAASPTAGANAEEEPTEAKAQSWSELAANGKYQQILEAADARGIDATLGSAGVGDLDALADAARYRGRAGLARRVLLTIRKRFSGSARAASAAFLIGRMADDGGNAASAVSWYDRYLAEAPGGPLAAEAFGRRMVALRKAGNAAASKAAARQYLERFPEGAYAKHARELLSR